MSYNRVGFPSDVQKRIDKAHKRADRIADWARAAWVLGFIVSLALTAAIIFVAAHFIGKYW